MVGSGLKFSVKFGNFSHHLELAKNKQLEKQRLFFRFPLPGDN